MISTHTCFLGRFRILNHVEVARGYLGVGVVNDLFSSFNKAEWVKDIQKREYSLKGFLPVVGESIDEQESRKFKKGPDTKVKPLLYEEYRISVR